MRTRECPSCAVEVEANVESCPICGYEFPKSKSWVKWTVIALIFGFLMLQLSRWI